LGAKIYLSRNKMIREKEIENLIKKRRRKRETRGID
jgi:hypothetical protein